MQRAASLLCCAVFIAIASFAGATPPNVITDARYSEPTTRYDHGILGDAVEWGALEITVDQCIGCDATMIQKYLIRLPETRVFEDVAPRIINLGDATTAVMVVETDLSLGARLAIYDESGFVTGTPFIGRTHRWLAPVGAADMDRDGQLEIAYVDRPHLAKTLRVWRYVDGALVHVADAPGLTNHRIGEATISGGMRNCANVVEAITVNADWTRVMGTRLAGDQLGTRDLGPFNGPASLTAALNCTG